MTASALILALALLAPDLPATTDAPVTTNAPPAPPAIESPEAAAPAPAPDAEPLPPGAPTDEYRLAAWCYGALSEYLDIYQRVKPEIAAIDKAYGPKEVPEPEPYAHDMAALRVELKLLNGAVQAAEKASARPIALEGAQAVAQGRTIWAPAESKTPRELARAWMTWGLPDRCASTSRALAAKSSLLGSALNDTDATAPSSVGALPAPPAEPPASGTPQPPSNP